MAQENINRANELRRDIEVVNNKLPISRLVDIDSAVIEYLKEKILIGLHKEDNSKLTCPVVYGSPELWKTVQADGYMRDTQTNKLRVPLVMIRRGNVARDRNKIKNIDANQTHVYRYVERQYTQVNKYDRFSATHNIIPKKQFYTIVIPDFVTITYNCKIWTDYITHMNQIIEVMNYADSSYWGIKDKFKFYTTVGDFGEIEEITTDIGRSVRTDFNLTLKGQIISQATQKLINSSQTALSINSLGITIKEK